MLNPDKMINAYNTAYIHLIACEKEINSLNSFVSQTNKELASCETDAIDLTFMHNLTKLSSDLLDNVIDFQTKLQWMRKELIGDKNAY